MDYHRFCRILFVLCVTELQEMKVVLNFSYHAESHL